MKPLILFVTFIVSLAFISCKNNSSDNSEEHANARDVILDDYQEAQQKFKITVAKIRDTQSFDKHISQLEDVVARFNRVADELKQLDPPDKELSIHIRKRIEQGNEASEPTGEDMLSLISIENRSKDVQVWIDSFTFSGRRVGSEFIRLYPTTKKLQNKTAHTNPLPALNRSLNENY